MSSRYCWRTVAKQYAEELALCSVHAWLARSLHLPLLGSISFTAYREEQSSPACRRLYFGHRSGPRLGAPIRRDRDREGR